MLNLILVQKNEPPWLQYLHTLYELKTGERITGGLIGMKLAEGRPRSYNNRDTLVTKLPFLTEQLSYQTMQLFCEQTVL